MSIHTAIGEPWARAIILEALREAASVSGRPVRELRGNYTDRLSTQARQAVIWDAHRKGVTQASLARFFKKDHTTIIHAIKVAQQRADDHAAFIDPPFFKSRRTT